MLQGIFPENTLIVPNEPPDTQGTCKNHQNSGNRMKPQEAYAADPAEPCQKIGYGIDFPHFPVLPIIGGNIGDGFRLHFSKSPEAERLFAFFRPKTDAVNHGTAAKTNTKDHYHAQNLFAGQFSSPLSVFELYFTLHQTLRQ